jgi:ABC-type multidrug transport system fused ATPase/permease subunit
VIDRYEKQNKEVEENGLNLVFWQGGLVASFMMIFGCFMAFGLAFGYYMLTGNSKYSIEPGQVITIIFMTFMTVTTLTGSTMLMKDIIEARNHAINLYYFIDHQNIIADKTESTEPIIDSIGIQVTNLDFK